MAHNKEFVNLNSILQVLEVARQPSVAKGRPVQKTPGSIAAGYDILGHCTSADLTYLSDRLAAIDGVAEYFQHMRDYTYMVDIWANTLACYLLWASSGIKYSSYMSDLSVFPTWT